MERQAGELTDHLPCAFHAGFLNVTPHGGLPTLPVALWKSRGCVRWLVRWPRVGPSGQLGQERVGQREGVSSRRPGLPT